MPRTCSICVHHARGAIDRALVGGESTYAIAAKYRDISPDALTRHKAGHLPVALAQGQQAREVAHADHLLDQANRLYVNAVEIMDEARGNGDSELALKAIGAAGRVLSLLGELLGELDRKPVVNLLIAPEWLSVRTAILEALQGHPDARMAVSERLLELEAGNAAGG